MAPQFIAVFGRLPRPLRLAVVAAAVAVLLYLSLAPTRDVPMASLLWDKAEHAIAYVVLMIVGLLFAPRRLLAYTVFALLLGIGVELLQASMGFGRQGDWRDLLANSLGIAVGFGLWRWMIGRRAA